jgi:tRNA-dihydrouridine synthase C
MTRIQAPGRLKQWVVLLTKSYPQAVVLFDALRRETDCERISQMLGVQQQEVA